MNKKSDITNTSRVNPIENEREEVVNYTPPRNKDGSVILNYHPMMRDLPYTISNVQGDRINYMKVAKPKSPADEDDTSKEKDNDKKADTKQALKDKENKKDSIEEKSVQEKFIGNKM